ncbi:hypothetical protein F511_25061 [Dorcoceras hygrometricum]|uniref:Uncharacterized protein n=1 Tax=Dorcoceras hygrometricum TaxID=472368 RepID=A0A2Z7C7K5_9LAMI|nr:hypothetical protein F511_25061 [Dorcoceras hygrometricum]
MEIPEINMISNFEAGVNCLQNPSLISRFLALPGIEDGFGVYSFWKWGALIFAILATFSGIMRRVKLIFIRLHTIIPSSNQIKHIVIREDDDISLASSSDDEEGEEEEERRPTTSFASQHRGDEYFFVKDSRRLRNRRRRIGGDDGFDWSGFTSGKNVVKLWDSLSSSFNIGLDFDDFDSDEIVSRWDSDHRRDSDGFSGRVSNIPAVVFSSEGNGKGDGVVLRGYDTRVRSRVPDLYAEWRSSPAAQGASLATSTTVIGGKIYVRDGVNGFFTVGDVRNVRMPLENSGDSGGETWWDADAVIMEDEYVVVDKST